jgi:hypothetical protein
MRAPRLRLVDDRLFRFKRMADMSDNIARPP